MEIENTVTALNATSDEMENMYLNINVGNEVYGIEIRYVLQIVGMQSINEMPEMPHGMKGYINLRGSVIPVFSMRLRFGKPEEAYNDRTCIVVVRIGEKDIGLIVDAIKETTTILPESIAPSPYTGGTEDSSYIMGIAKFENGQTAVLIYVNKLFSEQDI